MQSMTRRSSAMTLEMLIGMQIRIPMMKQTSTMCVDNAWSRFKAIFLQVADRHAPFIQKRVRGRDCPWITGQIKREIRHRDFLLKKARKSKLDEDWLEKTVRNRVSNIVRRAKQTYNKKLIKDHQDDSKTFWKTMKKILPGERNHP